MSTKLNINVIEDGSITKSKLSGDVTASLDKASDVDTKLPKSGGTMSGTITSQDIIPEKNETYSLGSKSYKYSKVYATTFNGNATNATIATKLGTSTIGSSTQPIYLNAGNPVKISSIPEDMISRVASTSGNLSIIDAAGDGIFASNRLAFKNPDEITVEYSNNGGETWLDYEVSDENKTRICTIKGGGVYLGKRHSSGIPVTEENPITQNDMLRVIISGNDRYFNVRKFLIYLSTNSHGYACNLYVDVERSTWKEPDNWIEVRKDVQVSGWSGWNSIYVYPNTSFSWGSSNQQNNTGRFRFTFKYGEGSSTGSASVIYNIFATGETMFSAPTSSIYSAMADTSHLYSYDIKMNARFPGDINPHVNKSKDLGSSSLMWNNVYSNKYYEDGVDISTKYALKSELIDTNYYPTAFSWTGGTTSGPTGSLTGSGMTAVSFGAIPSASSTESGIVTTGDQIFGGNKTFSGTTTFNNPIIFSSSRDDAMRPWGNENPETKIYTPLDIKTTHVVKNGASTTNNLNAGINITSDCSQGGTSNFSDLYRTHGPILSLFTEREGDSNVTLKSQITLSAGAFDNKNINNTFEPFINLSTENLNIYTTTTNIQSDNITLGATDSIISLPGKINKLYLPTSSDGSTYGVGTSGQVIKSNGSIIYWASDNNDLVKYTDTTTNTNYPLIFSQNSYSAITSGNNYGIRYNTGILLNPSKKYLTGITTISPYIDDASNGCTNNTVIWENNNCNLNLHGTIVNTGLFTHTGSNYTIDYVCIAEIYIVGQYPGYTNSPIMFEIVSRNQDWQNRVHVHFTYPGSGEVFPTGASLYHELPWDNSIYLVKTADDSGSNSDGNYEKWHLVVEQKFKYENIDLIRASIPAYVKNYIKVVSSENHTYWNPTDWNDLVSGGNAIIIESQQI